MQDRNFASTCKLEESSPEGLEVLPHEQRSLPYDMHVRLLPNLAAYKEGFDSRVHRNKHGNVANVL